MKRFTIFLDEAGQMFDRSRSAVGLIYNLSKKASVEGGFIYRHELNAYNRTNRDFVYSLTYSYEF